MSLPKVSIITVNYKQASVTCELLDSINALTYPNLEIILVDNDQPHDNSALFKIHLPKVKVVNSKTNLGFAGGNNLGLEHATGNYILLLNNDTVITDGVIEGLYDVFKADGKIGAVSPVLKYFEAPNTIQFAGFTEIDQFTGRNEIIKEKPDTSVSGTPYFHGAAVMISKKAIEACGRMPEEYFLYYEELEWSRQMTNKGYKIKVATELEILHKESVSTGKNSPLKVYYQNRNRVHYMRKDLQGVSWFLMFYLIVSLPKNLLCHCLKREWSHTKALLIAVKDSIISPKFGQQIFS